MTKYISTDFMVTHWGGETGDTTANSQSKALRTAHLQKKPITPMVWDKDYTKVDVRKVGRSVPVGRCVSVL